MKILCRHDLFRDKTIIDYNGDQMVIKPIIGELTDNALIILRHRFDERFGFAPLHGGWRRRKAKHDHCALLRS